MISAKYKYWRSASERLWVKKAKAIFLDLPITPCKPCKGKSTSCHTCFAIWTADVVVPVVELPQTPEDDLEALELRVEGGRVSNRWGMCVVSHGYGGFGGGMDGCVG